MIETSYETEIEKTYKGPDGIRAYRSVSRFSLLKNAISKIEEENRKGFKFLGLYKIQKEKIDYVVP